MFKRIVVPLDGSELAERALPRATELARLADVPLHVVRVVDLGKLAGSGSLTFGVAPRALQRTLDDEEHSAREYVERTRRDLKRAGSVVTSELRYGVAAREIVAATQPGDLIVMATHGRGGVTRWFLGRVAEEVVRRAAGPVMLVRATATGTITEDPEEVAIPEVRELVLAP